MKDLHCSFCFFHAGHLDESVSFGTMRVAVVDDFDLTNRTHSFEQILKVVFGGVIREISNVEAFPIDLRTVRGRTWLLPRSCGFSSSTAPSTGGITDVFFPWATLLFTASFGRGLRLGFVEPKEFEDLLPGRQRLGFWLGRATPGTVSLALPLVLALLVSLATSAPLLVAVPVSVTIPVAIAIPVAIPVSRPLGGGATG